MRNYLSIFLTIIFFSLNQLSAKEIKRFEIYDNFPHNWTLFGTKLYSEVDNLDIIGKFLIYEIKENEKKTIMNFNVFLQEHWMINH